MALDFCTHEDVVFEDAPLVMVLSQIRFPPILSLMAAAGESLPGGAARRLPHDAPGDTAGIGPPGAGRRWCPGQRPGVEVHGPVQAVDGWHRHRLCVPRDPAYSDISEFLQRFEWVVDVDLGRFVLPKAFASVFARSTCSRFLTSTPPCLPTGSDLNSLEFSG